MRESKSILILTESGQVIAFGSNQNRLLTIDESTYGNHLPTNVTANFNLDLQNNEKIIDIDLSEQVGIAITNLGKILFWGNAYNTLLRYLNLGTSIISPVAVNANLNLAENNGVSAFGITTNTIMLYSNEGDILVWGSNSNRQLGINSNYENQNLPLNIKGLIDLKEGEKITSFKMSSQSSIFLTNENRVFATGNNNANSFFVSQDEVYNYIKFTEITPSSLLSEGEVITKIFNSHSGVAIFTNHNQMYYSGNNSLGQMSNNPNEYVVTQEPINIMDNYIHSIRSKATDLIDKMLAFKVKGLNADKNPNFIENVTEAITQAKAEINSKLFVSEIDVIYNKLRNDLFLVEDYNQILLNNEIFVKFILDSNNKIEKKVKTSIIYEPSSYWDSEFNDGYFAESFDFYPGIYGVVEFTTYGYYPEVLTLNLEHENLFYDLKDNYAGEVTYTPYSKSLQANKDNLKDIIWIFDGRPTVLFNNGVHGFKDNLRLATYINQVIMKTITIDINKDGVDEVIYINDQNQLDIYEIKTSKLAQQVLNESLESPKDIFDYKNGDKNGLVLIDSNNKLDFKELSLENSEATLNTVKTINEVLYDSITIFDIDNDGYDYVITDYQNELYVYTYKSNFTKEIINFTAGVHQFIIGDIKGIGENELVIVDKTLKNIFVLNGNEVESIGSVSFDLKEDMVYEFKLAYLGGSNVPNLVINEIFIEEFSYDYEEWNPETQTNEPAVYYYYEYTYSNLVFDPFIVQSFEGLYDDIDIVGYEILDWYLSIDSVTNEPIYKKETDQFLEGFTLTPRLKEVPMINLVDNEGNEINKFNYVDGVTPLTIEVPTKENHTFKGWMYNNELHQSLETISDINGHITLTAVFEANNFDVTYLLEDGTIYKKEAHLPGVTLSLPTNPTKEGYVFNGWKGQVYAIMPSENITYTATWLKYDNTNDYGTVEGLNDALDTENEDYGINVKVEAVVVNNVLANEKTLIDQHIKNDIKLAYYNLFFFDITVNAINKATNETTKITETKNELIFTLTIPVLQRGAKNYTVLRLHNGVVTKLDTTYDEKNHTISFETDKFSTYSVMFEPNNTPIAVDAETDTHSHIWFYITIIVLFVSNIITILFMYNKMELISEKKQRLSEEKPVEDKDTEENENE